VLTLNPKQIFMQELIDKLKAEAGLTEEQAKQAVETIKTFVVEKFPMLEGAIGSLFGSN
jgi:nucleoid DNA-binding protein